MVFITPLLFHFQLLVATFSSITQGDKFHFGTNITDWCVPGLANWTPVLLHNGYVVWHSVRAASYGVFMFNNDFYISGLHKTEHEPRSIMLLLYYYSSIIFLLLAFPQWFQQGFLQPSEPTQLLWWGVGRGTVLKI